MFKIIAADQKEYGPVTSDQMRQWIAENRVNAQTQVQIEGTGDWQTLAEIPEFAETLNPPRSPPLRPASPPATTKTSGMAIASLVLGILGLFTCGTTALVGLVLGFIAMSKIKASGGKMGGHGLALAGTIVSGVLVLMLPVWAGMLFPALSKAKQKAQTINCVNNLKQLGLAIRMYAIDNNDQFPPAATWGDAIRTEVGSAKPFQCPVGDSSQRCHYAFNAKLGGMDESKVSPNTVMIFESSGGWNQHGGPELMLTRSRHGRTFVVALADGSVQQVTEAQLKTLRWNP